MDRANIDRSSDASFDAFPQEWLDELKMTSALIYEIAGRFGSKVIIRIFDPRSLPGIFKAIRYQAFRHPTFVIGGKEKVVGNQKEMICQLISEKIRGMTIT